jgi:hypothetical protein
MDQQSDIKVTGKSTRRGSGRLGLIWLLACTAVGGLLLAKGAQPTRAAGLGVAAAARHGDAPRRVKNIEDVQAGEWVWAYDVRSGAWSIKPVLRPLVHQYDGELVTLTVLGRRIEATANHPFWVTSGAELSRRPAATDVPVAERASLDGIKDPIGAAALGAGWNRNAKFTYQELGYLASSPSLWPKTTFYRTTNGQVPVNVGNPFSP